MKNGKKGIITIHFAKKTIMVVLIVVFVLLVIGFISESVRQEAEDIYDAPGDFVDYEDTRIHYQKKGNGNQTVVFSAGNGTASPYTDMYHLQKEICADIESITYERPGYGWSDATSRPRSIDTMTSEMEKVLDEASDNHSFIFVGHSIAALEIVAYAQQHPDKVDGIVLIDGVHPQYANEMDRTTPVSIHLTKFFNKTGVLRLLSNFRFFQDNLIQGENLPNDAREKGVRFALDRMWNKTMLQERKAIPKNGKQVNNRGDLGDIPLVIFSAEKNPMEGWKQSQETLPELSEHAEQSWVNTDNHFVHHEKPELVVEKIKQLLEKEA